MLLPICRLAAMLSRHFHDCKPIAFLYRSHVHMQRMT